MSDGDEPLADGAELLHRHVHPSWMVDGEPTSLAFRPSKKDEGRLSVARGSLATPEQAFLHHTSTLKLDAVGTWSFTVEEASAAGLKSYADPITTDPPDPAHAIVDFRGLSNTKQELAAKRLKRAADARGRSHPPAEG